MATQSKPTPTKRYQSRLKKLEKEDYLIRATRALFTPAYYNKVPKQKLEKRLLRENEIL
jgi:hypothetical protein